MPRPEDFFKGGEERRAALRARSARKYQAGILTRYFSGVVDPAAVRSMLADPSVKDLMSEAARVSGSRPLGFVRADLIHVGAESLLGKFMESPPAARLMEILMEERMVSGGDCAALVFTVDKRGPWVAHTMGQAPDPVKGRPRVVYPGDRGVSITVQPLEVFIKERF